MKAFIKLSSYVCPLLVRTGSVATYLRRAIPRQTILLVLALVCLVCAAATGWSATIFQTEDFQSGDTAGWLGASPTNQATGGPAGVGDRFLQITGAGGNGPFSVPAVHHSGSDWTGDYVAAGVTGLNVDLMNPASSNPLQLRLVLFGPASLDNRWTSTTSTLVPNDGLWRTYTFGISENDMTRVLGNSTFDDLASDVRRMMLRHDTGSPSPGGSGLQAQLGVDNITLVPEPAFHRLWGCLLVLLHLLMVRSRSPQACSTSVLGPRFV